MTVFYLNQAIPTAKSKPDSYHAIRRAKMLPKSATALALVALIAEVASGNLHLAKHGLLQFHPSFTRDAITLYPGHHPEHDVDHMKHVEPQLDHVLYYSQEGHRREYTKPVNIVQMFPSWLTFYILCPAPSGLARVEAWEPLGQVYTPYRGPRPHQPPEERRLRQVLQFPANACVFLQHRRI